MDRTTLVKNKIKEKLREKKFTKVMHLRNKKTDKRYKKVLLMRIYEEDEASAAGWVSKHQKELRAKLLTKYKAVLEKQRQDDNIQSASEAIPVKQEEAKVELLKDVIASIKEDYFSDLNVDDIPDDEVSDVDESEIEVDKLQQELQASTLNTKIRVQEQIID